MNSDNVIKFSDILLFILVFLICGFITFIPVWVLIELHNDYLNQPVYYEKYEVVDYNNNNIIAYNCSSGGYNNGSAMKCVLKDGTILSVKQYKYVDLEYIGIRKDLEMK